MPNRPDQPASLGKRRYGVRSCSPFDTPLKNPSAPRTAPARSRGANPHRPVGGVAAAVCSAVPVRPLARHGAPPAPGARLTVRAIPLAAAGATPAGRAVPPAPGAARRVDGGRIGGRLPGRGSGAACLPGVAGRGRTSAGRGDPGDSHSRRTGRPRGYRWRAGRVPAVSGRRPGFM